MKASDSGFIAALAKLPFGQLDPVFNAIFEGLLIVNSRGVVVAINNTAQLLYMNREPLTPGMNLSDYAEQDWVEVKRVLSSGQAQAGKLLILPEAEVLINRSPIFLGNQVAGVISTLQDINVYDGVVKQLAGYRQLTEELEAILEQYGDALLVVDTNGIIVRVNTAYERLVALGRQALLGRSLSKVRRGPAQLFPLVQEVLQQQTRVVGETVGAEQGNYKLMASPAFNENGDLSLIVVRIQDLKPVSERVGLLHKATALTDRTLTVGATAQALPLDVEEKDLQALCAEADIVIHSRPMLGMVRQSLKVSLVDSSVLLQGESGVGKSMLANLIHRHSPRKSKPFIIINCGAIPETLMESELFGYERGAFTGADPKGKIGLLEAANQGTVFFDEIGELKFPLQVKLLEVIEQKSFIRVGSTKRMAVDIRIIAATNRDLENEVLQGNFRKDLFYRLNVIPLLIPPLRERPEDIAAIALKLLAKHNARQARPKQLSAAVLQWLMNYDFPGNTRELVNIMEWMLVMSEQDLISVHDLPVALNPQGSQELENLAAHEPLAGVLPEDLPNLESAENLTYMAKLVEQTMPLKDAMEHLEASYLRQVIGSQPTLQAAAKVLDIHFSTLWRKMLQYNLKKMMKNEYAKNKCK